MNIFTKTLFITLTAIGFVFAHGDDQSHHQHSDKEAAAPAEERPSVSGKIFDVVLEICKEDKVYLHISNSETNQPLSNATIEASLSGDVTLASKATASKAAGVYELPLSVKPGSKVTLTVKVAAEDKKEDLTMVIVNWPKAINKCSY